MRLNKSIRAAAIGVALSGLLMGGAHAAEMRGLAYAEFVLASYDANGDGELTQVEFDATGKANFNDIDEDLNGIASAEEIASWYVSYVRQ